MLSVGELLSRQDRIATEDEYQSLCKDILKTVYQCKSLSINAMVKLFIGIEYHGNISSFPIEFIGKYRDVFTFNEMVKIIWELKDRNLFDIIDKEYRGSHFDAVVSTIQTREAVLSPLKIDESDVGLSLDARKVFDTVSSAIADILMSTKGVSATVLSKILTTPSTDITYFGPDKYKGMFADEVTQYDIKKIIYQLNDDGYLKVTVKPYKNRTFELVEETKNTKKLLKVSGRKKKKKTKTENALHKGSKSTLNSTLEENEGFDEIRPEIVDLSAEFGEDE